ncbi:hypothetical protein [Desulfosarcina sp.]|uniref:hypothetical protein n=1 Tax=Desulfosarcina sp. TaxID=2027861 RepID=UPI00356A2035
MLSWYFARTTGFSFSALFILTFLSIPVLSQAAQVTLTWDPNDPAPDGYSIYLRAEGQAYDYSQPCWTGYGTIATVYGLEENVAYFFVVRAFVGVQESADSIEVKFNNGTSSLIWIEAEDGDLQLPMEIGADPSASAGGYVWVPEGTGSFTYPSVNAGYAEFYFEVPEAGDYIIWGRQISNDSASDSFFVSVDGQEELVWHTKLGGQGVWTWDVVSDRDVDAPRDATNPQVYWLEAGFHTLTIRQGEDGTRLDTIAITNDFNLGVSDLCVKLAADVNSDGVVNILDFAQLRSDYGKNGDPGWIPTDVNSDGYVNILDFAILRNLYGQSGCQ